MGILWKTQMSIFSKSLGRQLSIITVLPRHHGDPLLFRHIWAEYGHEGQTFGKCFHAFVRQF